MVPSLFPYMVLSRMLADRLTDTRLPRLPICLLLGALGGSPSGAVILSSCAFSLSSRQLIAASVFSGTISPMFFLATIASWTDMLLGKKLLFCQFLGAVLSGICAYACFPAYALPERNSKQPVNNAHNSPLRGAIDAILQVGGCIICFSVLAGLLSLLPFIPDAMHPLIHAMLEISGGSHSIAAFSFSASEKAVLLAAATGFGGLSILSQNLLFLKPLGITSITLTGFSILRAIVSALFMALLI